MLKRTRRLELRRPPTCEPAGQGTKTSLGRAGVNPGGASFVSAPRRMKGIIGPERTGDEIVFCIR